ncbi:MAG: CPBP family glutamic-type intramembrane protease [Chthoniobacteraceae bacterium]
MKEIGKILVYLAAVLTLGALLAPPLFWLGQWAAHWPLLKGLGDFGFQKYFNRAELIAAVVLLWPLIRSLRVTGWRDLGLRHDPMRWPHLFAGFVIGGLVVIAMATGFLVTGFYQLRGHPDWAALPLIFLSAVVVATLEETLFRGLLLGLCLRSMRPLSALFAVTTLFAALHFLKPDDSFEITNVHWLSGFALLPHSFYQFANKMLLLAGFSTIFVLGWVLGLARLKTGGLWMSIGLHAGVVFLKMGLGKLARRKITALPWNGTDIQVGLVPLATLVLMGILMGLYLTYERKRHPARCR